MNVILYCRVSSDEQAEGTSLDFQERRLREYCGRKSYRVLDCKREDFSGKHHDLQRPEMKSLYEYCKKNKKAVDKVLFLKWDRFTRNAEFAYRYIREFNEMGIEINSIENPIDFGSPDWPTLIGIYCGNAQSENNKISKRTKDGIRETLLKGRCANKAPRGYKNVRTGKHATHVEIDESKAGLVRKIFQEVAKGLETPNYIRKKLARHIPETSYFTMLRNKFYIGKIRIPAFEDEREHYIQGVHEALIDEDTFYKVQEILDGKKKNTPKLKKAINPDLFLRQFLVCPVCGHALTGSVSRGNGGQYAYYNCCKEAKHIRARAEKVNEGFAKYVASLKPNPTVMALYEAILQDLKDEQGKDTKAEIKRLEIEQEKLRQRQDALDDKYMDDAVTKEQYDRMSGRYQAEASTLQQNIETLKTLKRTNIEPQLAYSISLVSNIGKYVREAPVEIKIKLLSSMFPEKIEFDGETYRTNSYNKVLDLIFQQTNELRGEKKEKGERFSSFSRSVPRPGVEPGWILLHWCLRPARLPIPPSGHSVELRCKDRQIF